MPKTKPSNGKSVKLRIGVLIPARVHRLGKELAAQDYRSLSAEIVTLIEKEAERRKLNRNGNGNGKAV